MTPPIPVAVAKETHVANVINSLSSVQGEIGNLELTRIRTGSTAGDTYRTDAKNKPVTYGAEAAALKGREEDVWKEAARLGVADDVVKALEDRAAE